MTREASSLNYSRYRTVLAGLSPNLSQAFCCGTASGGVYGVVLRRPPQRPIRVVSGGLGKPFEETRRVSSIPYGDRAFSLLVSTTICGTSRRNPERDPDLAPISALRHVGDSFH